MLHWFYRGLIYKNSRFARFLFRTRKCECWDAWWLSTWITVISLLFTVNMCNRTNFNVWSIPCFSEGTIVPKTYVTKCSTLLSLRYSSKNALIGVGLVWNSYCDPPSGKITSGLWYVRISVTCSISDSVSSTFLIFDNWLRTYLASMS